MKILNINNYHNSQTNLNTRKTVPQPAFKSSECPELSKQLGLKAQVKAFMQENIEEMGQRIEEMVNKQVDARLSETLDGRFDEVNKSILNLDSDISKRSRWTEYMLDSVINTNNLKKPDRMSLTDYNAAIAKKGT